VIGDRSALRLVGCNLQLAIASGQESRIHSPRFLPASRTGIQGPPCLRRPAGVAFPSVAKAELRLDRHHHLALALALALRVGIVDNGYRGTAQLSETAVRLTENTETQNTTDPRAVRRCALGLRWTTGLPPLSSTPRPRLAEPSRLGPAAHQDLLRTHSSRELPLSTLPLPYPSLKRVSDVPGVCTEAPMPSRSSLYCTALLGRDGVCRQGLQTLNHAHSRREMVDQPRSSSLVCTFLTTSGRPDACSSSRGNEYVPMRFAAVDLL